VGEADVVAVPRRRSRAEGEQLLCEYEASGLTQPSQLGTYPAAKSFVFNGGLPKVCTTF
jgi:hypothetical protein